MLLNNLVACGTTWNAYGWNHMRAVNTACGHTSGCDSKCHAKYKAKVAGRLVPVTVSSISYYSTLNRRLCACTAQSPSGSHPQEESEHMGNSSGGVGTAGMQEEEEDESPPPPPPRAYNLPNETGGGDAADDVS